MPNTHYVPEDKKTPVLLKVEDNFGDIRLVPANEQPHAAEEQVYRVPHDLYEK